MPRGLNKMAAQSLRAKELYGDVISFMIGRCIGGRIKDNAIIQSCVNMRYNCLTKCVRSTRTTERK